ncbi:MAG: hypothetical protein VX790_03730, partial [Bacteroidota bacterium]|nr:hypothetical protein [Bacteroidota bacterium]
MDKLTYSGVIEYKWKTKNNNRIDFSLVDLTLVNNRNTQNYFNIYTNTYSQLNTIAQNTAGSSSFLNDNNLIIPDGATGF